MFGATNGSRDKVWVEAERSRDGRDAILTLADVSLRRKMAQENNGRHNATLQMSRLESLGFPMQLVADLERGRPVRFRMNTSAFSDLVHPASGGPSALSGLGGHGNNQSDYTHYVVHVTARRNPRQIASGWSYKEDAQDALRELLPQVQKNFRVYTKTFLRSKGLDPDDDRSWTQGTYPIEQEESGLSGPAADIEWRGLRARVWFDGRDPKNSGWYAEYLDAEGVFSDSEKIWSGERMPTRRDAEQRARHIALQALKVEARRRGARPL